MKGPGINGTLYRLPLGGGEETAVLEHLRDDAAFAPVEQGVYYIPYGLGRGMFQGGGPLYFHDFATGQAKPVAGIEAIQSRFAISPDGRSIVFARDVKTNMDLMLVENFR
ncbi:MAG: hypothetical protein LAQ30_28010 [Acidobacteriia bacterium]|nr:hypothetical protein [Terriglobia bacterium]